MKPLLMTAIVIIFVSTWINGSYAAGKWKKARLSHYISYPECCDNPNAPDRDECDNYNACKWKGQFAFVSGSKPLSWVKKTNIISVHSKDSKYRMKTFEIRKNGNTIRAKVYDKCDDSDCNGCCTKNAGKEKFLIDMEIYTYRRFRQRDGVVEWRCLDC